MKVWNYLFIMITMSVLLDLAGFLTNTSLLTLAGFSRDTTTNAITFHFDTIGFFQQLFYSGAWEGILIGLGAAITVGLFTKGSTENFIILPIITGTLATITSFFISILIDAASHAGEQTWIIGILAAILVPFTFGYVFALIEFFRGTD